MIYEGVEVEVKFKEGQRVELVEEIEVIELEVPPEDHPRYPAGTKGRVNGYHMGRVSVTLEVKGGPKRFTLPESFLRQAR